MKEYPLVTIGVASYNNAAYITETLSSVYHQRYPNLEIMVVDDRSTDGSPAVIEAWIGTHQNRRVSLEVNQENSGIVGVANKLLSRASGKYFILFGSDDVMLEHHVEELVDQFESLEKEGKLPAFIYTPVFLINGQGERLPAGEGSIPSSRKVHFFENGYAQVLLGKVKIPAPGVMVRTSALKPAGYDPRYFQEDFPLWLRLSKNNPYGYYESPNVQYRIHSGSLMATKKARLLQNKIGILLDELERMDEGAGQPLKRLLIGKIRDKCFELLRYDAAASARLLREVNRRTFSPKSYLYSLLIRAGLVRFVKG
ncbi:glycosyltransferase [Paraflavisolibacter sp. H34]|uniref:glycosyltransferase family 2 protein n=1 Tax=Huijunlia imazamoxiresistens TaxID=3127457 RepID=UPI003016124A